MRRPRYSEDQIIELLRQAELRLAQGEPLSSVCKSLGISQSSYRRWREKYDGQVTDKVPELSKEAEKLLDAANDASGAARNAWLAFLGLLAYLLITLGGVSHKDLLLNSPVKLPIINVEIPLFSFFQYAPLLLLLVYLALLIQHVMLAGKFRKFTEAIEPHEKKTGTEHPSRQLVHPYVVAQILAGPKQNLLVRWLMRLMVFVTFAVLPVLTLLYFQVTFLPYHAVGITYWHRVAVLLGLILLFAVLPIIHLRPRKREIKIGPPGVAWQKSPLGILIGFVSVSAVLFFSFFIATVPDEGMDQLVGFDAPKHHSADSGKALLNPLVHVAYDWIPDAENPDDRGWLLSRLISFRVLVVEDADLVADEGDAHGEVSQVLRERNFRFARLSRSDLHRADLTKADLRGAMLDAIRLQNAKLEHAQLQGASLENAQLQGARLADAQLPGANLNRAQLQGANLVLANLQGADLAADEGVVEKVAVFMGEEIAKLFRTNLQAANLVRADLEGADLRSADLRGADLRSADLMGADLRSADLRGADLRSAIVLGADFHSVYVWLARADLPFSPARLFQNASPQPLGLKDLLVVSLTADEKAELKKTLEDSVTDTKLLKRLRERLDPLFRDKSPTWADELWWHQKVRGAYDPASHELVAFLRLIACNEPNGYVALVMARRAQSYNEDTDRSDYAKPLAEALLDENCEGAKALTDETQAELRELIPSAE